MAGRFFIICLLFLIVPFESLAQWPEMPNGRFLNPADRTMPYKHLDFTGSLINYVEGQLWQFTFSGGIPLFNDMHELSVDIPFIRSEYTGIENLSGIGDIRLNYKILTYESKRRVRTLASSALYASLSFPTGNEFSGHGAGVPVFSPGFMLAYRPVQQIAIYPDIRYTHSFGEVNSEWGGGFTGVTPGTGPDAGKIRFIQTQVLFNGEVNEFWVGLAPQYIYSFKENEGTLNLQPELGKLFSDTIYLKLSGSFYIAGRRRILNSTMFRVAAIF